MRAIYKYKLYAFEEKYLGGYTEVPTGAELLKVAVQHGQIFAWYAVDPDKTLHLKEKFAILATGQEIGEAHLDSFTYIDTVFIGNLVWHIYKQ